MRYVMQIKITFTNIFSVKVKFHPKHKRFVPRKFPTSLVIWAEFGTSLSHFIVFHLPLGDCKNLEQGPQ